MTNSDKVQTIFTKKHYINLIASLIIWLSSVFCIYKFFENSILKTIFYSIVFPVVLVLIERFEKYYKSFLTKNILFLIMLIITAAAVLLHCFGYIGNPTIVGFSILWLVIIYYSQSVKISLIQIAVFLLSSVLYIEMISFSGSFLLIMLVIVSIFISERFLDSSKFDWKFFLIAFLFGVTLSVERLVNLIYIIYVLYAFRNDFTKMIVFVAVLLAAYELLNFLTDKNYLTFLASETNHLKIQLPVWIWILLSIITLYVGWIVADLQEVLFASGIILFTIYILSFILRVAAVGWNKNEIDFSLLIMAIPFLVLSINEYKVDRYLGKV